MLLGVADGIGSHPFGGSVAKWLTKTYLAQASIDFDECFAKSISSFVRGAHAEFLEEFNGFDDFLKSGCTISIAAIKENKAIIVWAGDSPVFHTRYSEQFSIRMTTPHCNALGELTSCFCGDLTLDISSVEIDLVAGDVVTIASDGVVVDEMTLLEASSTGAIGEEFVHRTLKSSTESLGSDDSTMICYQH